jgi:hypothetical protein
LTKGIENEKTREGNSLSQGTTTKEGKISKNFLLPGFRSFTINFKAKKPNVKKSKSISVKKIVEKK